LAKLPTDIRVIGDDISNKFLLLSNSHDGTSSVQIKFTPIRVVCANTLTMALQKGPTIRVSHTKDLHERLRIAEQTLGLVNKRFEDIEKSFIAMTKVKISSSRLSEYLNLVFPDPPDPQNRRAIERIRQNRAQAEHLFANGKGTEIKGVAGTLWAAYNGIAEFVDHRGKIDSKHLESIWFGDGYLIKARAFAISESRINAWMS
jgi:phage/plasmid-like protein (TIGR03299 family)